MIIEVHVDGEESPRRYRVRRRNGDVFMNRVDLDAAAGKPLAEPMAIDWRAPEPGVYSLLLTGHSYDVHVDEDRNDEERLAIHLLSHVVSLQASDARKRRVRRTDAGPEGPVQVVAPIPGRVVRILAAAGSEVHRGDGIVVVEAMKMENELKAPRDGVVTRVMVEPGQGVEGGALLATIE